MKQAYLFLEILLDLQIDTFDANIFNNRINRPAQRRTIGYYIQRKFSPTAVLEKLKIYGFNNDYKKIIVSWGWGEAALQIANENHIELWDFYSIIRELADSIQGNRKYFSDDTLGLYNCI